MITTHPFQRHPAEDDKLHEECGVFGIYGFADAAAHTALGLHALQHRGQEATGIVSYDGTHFNAHRDMGLVGDTFSSSSCTSRTVLSPSSQSTRRMPSSASVGLGDGDVFVFIGVNLEGF